MTLVFLMIFIIGLIPELYATYVLHAARYGLPSLRLMTCYNIAQTGYGLNDVVIDMNFPWTMYMVTADAD